MEILSISCLFSIRTKRKLFKMIFYSILTIPPFICGCWPGADLIGAYEKDVSNRKELWGGYAKGQQYILLTDIFLQKEESELGFKYRLYAGVPPRELMKSTCTPLCYSAPSTIETYRESPEQWPLIIGIMKAGTEIECTKIIGSGTLMWSMSYDVYATVKDGAYAGVSIDIHDLSFISWVKSGWGEDYVMNPNPSLLKRVNIDTEENEGKRNGKKNG